MSYQAVVRSSSGQLATNHTVGMRINILQGSVTVTPVYVEIHTSAASSNGLVTVETGGGTVISGTFERIYWPAGTYFIKSPL